jgi:hypothetical protein
MRRGGRPLKKPSTPSSLRMVTRACRAPSYLEPGRGAYPDGEQRTATTTTHSYG